MRVEHTAPLFSCQMQWCCSVLHLEQVVDVLVELQKDIIIQQVNGLFIIAFKHVQIVTLIAKDSGQCKRSLRTILPKILSTLIL